MTSDRTSSLFARSAGISLAITLLLTLLALAQVVDLSTGRLRLSIDPSTDRILSEDSEAKQFYDYTRRVFGNDENLLIVLSADDVFTPGVIARIDRMADRIQRLKDVHHVASLTNALDIRGVEEGLEIEPFISGPDIDQKVLDQVRERVLGNPLYAGSLVSEDGTATAMVVYFHDIPERDFIARGDLDRISAIVEEERGDTTVWVTGSPQIKAATTIALLHDLIWTPPFVAVVLALVLAASFRTVMGVVAPMLTIFVGLIWTLGTISALGYSLNLVSALVPPLVMILGLSYSIYVVSEFHQLRKHCTTCEDVVRRTFIGTYLPIILAGITTIAGFAALMLSPIAAIREFGMFAGLGVVYTAFLSISLTPALLGLMYRARPMAANGAPQDTEPLFDRLLGRVARFDIAYRKQIFAGAVVLLLVGLAGMTQIRVGTETIGNFSPDSQVRRAFEAINEKLGGANPFYIVLDGQQRDAFKQPENLRLIESLQRWLVDQPEIGGASSLVDYIKLINQAYHDNDPEQFAIPDNRRLITQLVFFSASDELERFVEPKYQLTSILVRSRVIDSDRMSDLIARIEARLAHLPAHIKATVTGNPVLVNKTIEGIILGQVRSVVLALVIVYLILSLMFMSLRVGLVALVPNVLPIVVYFGALGLFGISLNPGTSLIAPMVLGVAIDDTIHYFARFSREVKECADDRRATETTLRAVGRPVTTTSVALCLGFLALMTSDLRMQQNVGLMAAFALLVAWASDFILTPALCSRVRIATLWEVLSLDLGHKPQESIPLLHGLRTSQAKIVALMGSIYEVPAGQRIIQAGEQAQEMFVIIEGKLRISVEGKGGEIDLGTRGRGEVVGEAGLFYEHRTANVDTIADTRLLRISRNCLDRLGKRYPFIAAKVFRNLSSLLAAKLADTTDRL